MISRTNHSFTGFSLMRTGGQSGSGNQEVQLWLEKAGPDWPPPLAAVEVAAVRVGPRPQSRTEVPLLPRTRRTTNGWHQLTSGPGLSLDSGSRARAVFPPPAPQWWGKGLTMARARAPRCIATSKATAGAQQPPPGKVHGGCNREPRATPCFLDLPCQTPCMWQPTACLLEVPGPGAAEEGLVTRLSLAGGWQCSGGAHGMLPCL